jgi:3-dehydroquinate synthase
MLQDFQVRFHYPVHFTENVFDTDNLLLKNLLVHQDSKTNVLIILDQGLEEANSDLQKEITQYFEKHNNTLKSSIQIMTVPGGEAAKNDLNLVFEIAKAVDKYQICRHSFVIGIGGGAVLDLVGFAAAISHRGIRHIRIPTTVLAQNDSGVGVKNGINFQGKKNFLGTFCPPFAVINDSEFLKSLPDKDYISGISEAVKVALIKDREFFYRLNAGAKLLQARDSETMSYLIKRCAELHLQHIGGNDPFESGSSRPLDFGHWSAHKMEQLSNHTIRHGEAVAVGIALDSIYSMNIGMLSLTDLMDILHLLRNVGFVLYFECLDETEKLLVGIAEFREHLGGKLTIMLLESIGKGVEVHEIQKTQLVHSLQMLKNFHNTGMLEDN